MAARCSSKGAGSVRSVAGDSRRRRARAARRRNHRRARPQNPAWPQSAAGAERLFAARDDGVVTAPRTVVAAVPGRFLPGDARQLAVATYAGHLVLLDEATGAVRFDAVWPAVTGLATADLDGDGRDELAGRVRSIYRGARSRGALRPRRFPGSG